MPARRRLALPLLLSTAVLLAPAVASAKTYCVNRVSNACTDTIPATGTIGDQLQAGLTAAGGNPGEDSLLVGGGTYDRLGGFTYNNGAGALFVQGAGVGTTTLTSASNGSATIAGGANSGSMTLRDLTAVASGGSGASAVRFGAAGSRVLAARVTGAPGNVAKGVEGSGFTVDSSVVDGLYDGIFSTGGSQATVLDSTLDVRNFGIYSASSNTLVRGVDARAAELGNSSVLFVLGNGTVETSVLDAKSASSGDNAKAITAQCDAGQDAPVTLRHVTLRSAATSGASVFCPAGGRFATLTIADSALAPGTSLRTSAGAGTATATITRSRWGGDVTTGVTPGAGNVTAAPGFVGATDLRPGAGSPLVDAAVVTGSPYAELYARDLAGAGRVLDGNGDGTAAPDIGAYERIPAAVAPPAGNLLTNPGAEDGAGVIFARTGTAAPPGWSVSGAVSQAGYGSPVGTPFAFASTGASLGAGNRVFVGGPDAAFSTATQTVDLSGQAAPIDAGRVSVTLSGLLGGNGEDDRAVLTASFAATGPPIGLPVVVGPVGKAARGGGVTLVRRSATGPVPAGARAVTVTLRAERDSAGDTYNDATFDDVALTTTTAPADPGPAAPGDTGPAAGAGGTGTAPSGSTPAGTLPVAGPPPLAAYTGLKLAVASGRIDRRGRIAVRASCPAAAVTHCTGRLELLRTTGKGKRRKTVRLTRVPVDVRAGTTKAIRLSVPRKARRTLPRKGSTWQLRATTQDARPGAKPRVTRVAVRVTPRR